MAKANVVNTKVVPSGTKVYPYYDDFNEEKNFYRILFRPGNGVQARELTQLQTILQNQIERFGRHIFVNGSSVIGGDINFSPIVSLNLKTTYANTAIDVDEFVDKTVTYSSGNSTVVARVIQGTPANDTEPPTLFVRYITGTEFGTGSTIKVDGEEVYANLVSTSNVKSNSTLAFINDSIYFYDGYFIKVPKQSLVVSKYDQLANVKVGLELDDDIITESSDSSLLDPALESSAYQAQGAARYQASLVLAKRSLSSIDDEKFIEISRLENGVLTKNINTPIYSEIEEVLARRTFDESGNYTVKPFIISMRDDPTDNANNVLAVISSGKGYIYGYEYESISDISIQIPRARTYANVSNYNLIANYGNYVIVDGLEGTFNTSGMGLFDIHCVPIDFVNRTSSTTYNTTKIGTGRVKDINFYSGDSDVETRKFEFYLFDTKFTKISGNASSTANSTSEVVLNSSTFSANNNAYDGATIKVTAGPAVGETRTVSSYDGATKIATVSNPFSTVTTANSTISIEFDFGEAESFVQSSVYTSGATSNANCNINILNKDNGASNGIAFISESSLSPLVFIYPEKFIVPGSIGDQSYLYRRVYTGIQFTLGNSTAISAGTGEGFEGTTSSSNVSSTVMDNFLVICTNNQGTSGKANGEQVKVTVTVAPGTPEQATFATGNTAESFLATIYAKMDVADSGAVHRAKTLVKANSVTFTSDAASNTFVNSTGSTTSVYLNAGQVLITNPSRTPGTKESLFISDVIAIKKIYDCNGYTPGAGNTLSSFIDVTNRFDFDSGQRDEYYDHASIKLKPGAQACVGPLIVCARYYKTTSDSGYFSVDSYPSLSTNITEEGENIGTGYSIIPKYRGVSLRDTIDFRPVRTNGANTTPGYTLGGVKIPVPATDFNSDYAYYLGRFDLITLNANKTISRIPGTPGKFPQLPTKPSRSMVLHTLYVPPYTDYPNNVSVKYADTKRYTMRDIGHLDKRISNLEYYVSLSELEKNTLDLTIEDVDGLDRAKYGVFVDTFKGHYLGDTTLSDYKISTDVNGRFSGDGMASAQSIIGARKLVPDIAGATDISEGLDRITIEYTEEEFIAQGVATKYTPVADYLYATFEGQILTNPEADIWRDMNNIDIVSVTYINNEYNNSVKESVPFSGSFGISDILAEAQRQWLTGGNQNLLQEGNMVTFDLGQNSGGPSTFTQTSDDTIWVTATISGWRGTPPGW